MEAPNRKAMVNPIARYQTLKLKESLSKPSLYLFACKELSFLLKNAYSKSPKNLQSIIFQETLFAFSLLPEFQTQSAISAANSLLQSAEFALPKQKRALAVTEHKHAVVASKRKSKTNLEEQGLNLLPQDILMHIFSFLDVQSLVSASAVCRSWNGVASERRLWKLLYASFFSNSENVTMHYGFKIHGVSKNEDMIHSLDDEGAGIGIDWKCACKTAFKGGGLLSDSSSDSDSDSEDASIFKLWAYPKQIV
ncbi:F-box protein at5g52880 [Phtheirospermum japonicum]|uniref:F-box protein at5g52880 n=1 Tax=Phtheirospermum japonicum TaxID=374723 RepID=A0A830B1T0_9LAMI|nr:F-box protein at5g52880 [Phtheirospermum japonicum]